MAETPTVAQYPGSQANLLQQANLNKTLLAENLADFTAEDDTIDTAYVAAYAQDITEAEESDSDELIEDTLSDKTATVKAAQKAVAKKVAQVRYYVLQAFETDKEVQHKFGLDAWNKARDSQTGTLQFLTKMHTVAAEYQTQLTAAGFGPTRTASILTARQALEDADNDQEHYRSSRPKLSALRIQEYNEVYARLTRINSLAQLVYADDYEMAKQFVFNPSGDSGGGDGTQYIGTVAAGETKTIATVTYGAATTVSLNNTGTSDLLLSLNVAAGTPEGAPIDAAPGEESSKTMEEMNPNALAVILQIKGAAEAGEYIVTVGG